MQLGASSDLHCLSFDLQSSTDCCKEEGEMTKKHFNEISKETGLNSLLGWAERACSLTGGGRDCCLSYE